MRVHRLAELKKNLSFFTLLTPDEGEKSCYVEELLHLKGLDSSCLQKISGESSIEEIYQATQPSLFDDEKKAIWIDPIDKISSFSFLRESKVFLLILSGTTVKANLLKPFEIMILDFSKEKKWDKRSRLEEFLQFRLKRAEKSISQALLQHVIQEGNENLALLCNEIEKLICFSGSEKQIDQQMIQSISSLPGFTQDWKITEKIVFGGEDTHFSSYLAKDFFGWLSQIRYQVDIGFSLALLRETKQDPTSIQQEYPHVKGSLLGHYTKLISRLPFRYFAEVKKTLFEVELQVKNAGFPPKYLAITMLAKLKNLREKYA